MADHTKIQAAFDSALVVFNGVNLVSVLGEYANEQIDTAWENSRYEPRVGRPYQEVFLLTGETEQPGNGLNGTEFDKGIYQVALMYPRDEGSGAAARRAELLRNYFVRSTLLSFGGTVVQVARKPSRSPAMMSPDWYRLVVSVPYFIYS